jgi:hypothetical protein
MIWPKCRAIANPVVHARPNDMNDPEVPSKDDPAEGKRRPMSTRTSIVVELQQLASNQATDIGELLRKSLVVATKLNLVDFNEWIESELNGYTDPTRIPDYRILRGDLRAINPYVGLIPFVVPEDIYGAISQIRNAQPISEVQHLIEDSRARNVSPRVRLPQNQVRALIDIQDSNFPLQPVLLVSAMQLVKIVEAVRTRVLEKALKLEAAGIRGDGMSFTDKEKALASLGGIVNIQGGVHNYENVQAAAVGPNAHAHDMTLTQAWTQSEAQLSTVAAELTKLRAGARKLATDPEHDQSLGELGAAEIAARKGDGAGVMKHLHAAGRWALETAVKITPDVLPSLIKAAIEMNK